MQVEIYLMFACSMKEENSWAYLQTQGTSQTGPQRTSQSITIAATGNKQHMAFSRPTIMPFALPILPSHGLMRTNMVGLETGDRSVEGRGTTQISTFLGLRRNRIACGLMPMVISLKQDFKSISPSL